MSNPLGSRPGRTVNIATTAVVLAIGLVGVPGLYLSGVIGIETVNMLGRYLCFALLALSLDLIWGYGGMLCLCQSFFFSLGGYAMGMFLAHHGGPEGIIDASGWKLPACLYVVYPYEVGQAPEEALVPEFWKPFWSLPVTLLLGMLIPGLAALIGFFVFRSRVRGVFFAILTQAVTLAAWLVFSMNQMMFCGTNGLTRFDRITPGFTEVIQIDVNKESLAEKQVEIGQVQKALESYQSEHGGSLSRSGDRFTSRPRKFQNVDVDFASLEVTSARGAVKLGDIAKLDVAGWRLSDSSVKFALYIITILSLLAVFIGCRVMIGSRFGRVLVAIRDNETRLRFAGYRPYVFKMTVFALSAMIAGLAGMLYAPQMQIFTPTNLEPKESILVVVWVAFGGRGTLSGPVIGALLVNLLYFFLTGWSPDTWPFLLGGLFVFVVIVMPDGVMGFWNSLIRMLDGQQVVSSSDEEPSPDSVTMTDRLQALAMRQRTDTTASHLDSPLLSVKDIQVHFDGFQALDIDHYSVPHYALNVIIGPNGAGKTTLCDVISGKTPVSQGRVEFAGADITWASEVDIARKGVGRKFQTPTVFDGLDVRQNMELALPGRQKLLRNLQMTSTSRESEQINKILERVRLIDDVDRPVKFLSHGQRQWLEISMLILSSPQLLLVDEPAAGLTDEETVLTAELLLELQDEHSIIVIEHDMEFVRLLNSRVTVLNEGKVIAQGSLDEVKQVPEVIEAYLGR